MAMRLDGFNHEARAIYVGGGQPYVNIEVDNRVVAGVGTVSMARSLMAMLQRMIDNYPQQSVRNTGRK